VDKKNNKMFEYDILTVSDFTIEKNGTKIYYNTDGQKTIKEWYKDETTNKVEYPGCSSVFNIVDKHRSTIRENSVGYFYSDSNSVEKNSVNVGIFTMAFSHGQGNSITLSNFTKVISAFSARRLINPDWTNEKDEYLIPNETHEQFEQYMNDSLVYSLFNNASYQSSLRQVEYKDKLWDIKNEFFWLSVDRMKELSDDSGYDELYNDARTASDRHVYKLLFGEERIYDKLSDDTKAVLDKATELVEKSMTMRQVMADDENHLNSWDAGYAQLKLVWKEYFEEDFKEFRKLYKEMEERMRPLVYELGFLMK
jgi:hypothetical protein